MRTLVTKPPTNDAAKQKKNGNKGRSHSISPLSTGMPLLQRQCACGGGCPRCQEELGVQTKLKISEPGDKYEQQADRIADEIMQMPEPSVQRQIEPEEEMVQRKASTTSISPASEGQDELEVPSIVHEVLRSPGQLLNPETCTFMESRFGHDFSQVRVHTDEKASESAQAVNAIAYTIGQDIVFETNQYTPRTNPGKQLLAHELTHVVQQSTFNTQQLQKQERSQEPTRREIQHEQRLTRFARFPLEAHRNWRQLNSGEQTFVIIRMVQLYGYEFTHQFQNFARLGRFDATPEFANRHEATTPIRFQGFPTLEAAGYRLATVDSTGFENWVHPSGRTIFVLHRSQSGSTDGESVPQPELLEPRVPPLPDPDELESPPRPPFRISEDELEIDQITTPDELRRILRIRK